MVFKRLFNRWRNYFRPRAFAGDVIKVKQCAGYMALEIHTKHGKVRKHWDIFRDGSIVNREK